MCGDNGDKAYSVKHMEKKIVEHFGNSIVISSLHGKYDIANLKQTAASIVHTFYNHTKAVSAEEEKKLF